MINVRLLNTQDIEQVRKLDSESEFRLVDFIEDNTDYAWGIFNNNILAGYCSIGSVDGCEDPIFESHKLYSIDAFVLSDVYISEEYRSRGYGHMLLKEAISQKRKISGNYPIYLELLFSETKAFYLKLGFENIDDYAMVLEVNSPKNF